MDEGSYNNVIRTNSAFSPMTPSTPGGTSYKANVNRTKTRKWVEAKAQNYDGDDWGNDSYDDEPEEPPSPPKPTGFRQLGQASQTRPPPDARPSDFLPSSRTFSQPSLADPPEPALGPRSPSVPPVLQRPTPPTNAKSGPVQASSGMVPDSAPQSSVPGRYVNEQVPSAQSADARHNGQPSGYPGRSSPAPSAAGQVPSLFPPRKSSMSRGSQQEGRDTDSPAHAAGTSGAPAKVLSYVRPADIYRKTGEEKESERHSMESGRPSMDSNLRSNLPSVAERESDYGMGRLLAESHKERSRESLRRLSPSPKLPEMPRMSGFGDDLFSDSIQYSSGVAPSLPAAADSQSTTTPKSPTSEPQYSSEVSGPGPAPREPSSIAAADDRKEWPESLTQPAGHQATSILEGPKLEANPDIVTSPSNEQAQRGSSSAINTPGQQPKSPRPHLPGGWVSETSAFGSAQPTPMELAQTPQPAPTVDAGNSQASPVTNAGVPGDLEPTTAIKHLSPTDNPKKAADVRAALESGRDDFNRPAGEHDDAVGSELTTSGTGHHPTSYSLPALKTENALDLRNLPKHHEQRYPPESTTGSSSSNQWTTATTSSVFAPAASLDHTRPSLAQPELVGNGRPRQSTMSTVETVSPAKESDKLREEIMKSLSLDPLTPQSSSGFLGNPSPSEQEVPRESRYLSGVYDDYLALVEDKSPQELGQTLKNESMVAGHTTTDAKQSDKPTPQVDTSIPEVQPLSSRKTPEPEPTKHPRRFSWEQSSEQLMGSPAETRPAGEATPRESGLEEEQRAQSPAISDSRPHDNAAAGPVSQSEATGTLSQELMRPGGYRGETLGSPASERSSPISVPTDNPARDTATDAYANSSEGKIIEPSSHPVLAPSPMEHAALSNPLEASLSIPPINAETPAAATSQQPKIMAFREILNLPSSDQRTQKFDETRNQFFGMDSGLSYWLLHMSGQLEQTSTTGPGDSQQTSSTAQAQPSPVGMQPSTQQPYYQQYLNASNPNVTIGPPGKVSTGNLMGQPGSTTSGFNTGNQVGARGKELLHAAGAFGNKGVKSGMKLFNKGKSKLRERTGDKVFF